MKTMAAFGTNRRKQSMRLPSIAALAFLALATCRADGTTDSGAGSTGTNADGFGNVQYEDDGDLIIFHDTTNSSANNEGLYNSEYSGPTFFRDCVGREDEKVFALTFDDGPHRTHTEPLLDILKSKNAHATFFWIGSEWDNFPGLVGYYDRLGMRVLLEGHNLANHGMTNDPFTVDEVQQCHNRLSERLGGYDARFFRPAQGAYSPQLLEDLDDALPGYKTAMWNIDTSDWKNDRDPEEILALLEVSLDNYDLRAPESDKPNFRFPRRGSFVMLAHDNQETFAKMVKNPNLSTSNAATQDDEIPLLAAAIDLIRSKGWTLVTLSECLGLDPPKFTEPTSYCGEVWGDASTCPTSLACPSGDDAACPEGMKCYGGIQCPTMAPTEIPTASPAPTLTAQPTTLAPIWGNVPDSAALRSMDRAMLIMMSGVAATTVAVMMTVM